jgi:hypothetical protein
MAYNGTDNGYAIFDHVRIPRTNLLMRHCQVSRDGRYAASPLRQKLAFGGMLSGRAIIIRAATFRKRLLLEELSLCFPLLLSNYCRDTVSTPKCMFQRQC